MTTTNQSLGLTIKFTQATSRACAWTCLNSRYSILKSFPVILSAGSHPFPSRTRKLSLLEPMVLRGKLRGRVGSRRDYLRSPREHLVLAGFYFIAYSALFTSAPSLAGFSLAWHAGSSKAVTESSNSTFVIGPSSGCLSS